MAKLILTQADYIAISNDDSNYIVNKGAKLYKRETFKESVEYYRLSSSMGNNQATSNLGYCYLYGRDIEQNVSLAIAYFMVAAKQGNIDAAYKLGDIYSSDKYVKKDKELSLYYYDQAVTSLLKDEYINYDDIRYVTALDRYPSLCFALGREMYPGGDMNTDLKLSYQYLLHAKTGYELELEAGNNFYQESYNNVLEYLSSEHFIPIKEYFYNIDKHEEHLYDDFDEEDE